MRVVSGAGGGAGVDRGRAHGELLFKTEGVSGLISGVWDCGVCR